MVPDVDLTALGIRIMHQHALLMLIMDWLLPGISLKTQELYALVFVTRYLDIFTNFISL